MSFLVNNGIGNGSALCWQETNTTGYVGAYVVAASSSPTEADTMANTWSTRTDVSTTNAIPALRFLFTTYPTNGVYTSAIFNTQSQTPPYSNMAWSTLVPSGAAVGFKVRTANSNDMSDATAWTNIATLTSGTINPGNKRYVQFRTTLQPTTAGTETPKVRDVRINWAGATEAVDVGGTFTKGPDYGIFEVLVNGQPLKKGVLVNLEIFDFARAHGTSNRITSAATAEVTPRNTGR